MWAVIMIMPARETDFETARSVTSLPFTLNMIGFAVGNLVIGRVIDRFGVASFLSLRRHGQCNRLLSGKSNTEFSAADGLSSAVRFWHCSRFWPLISDISHWFLKHRGIAVALIASGNYLASRIVAITIFIRYPPRTGLAGCLPNTSCSDFDCDYTPHLAAAPPPA